MRSECLGACDMLPCGCPEGEAALWVYTWYCPVSAWLRLLCQCLGRSRGCRAGAREGLQTPDGWCAHTGYRGDRLATIAKSAG